MGKEHSYNLYGTLKDVEKKISTICMEKDSEYPQKTWERVTK